LSQLIGLIFLPNDLSSAHLTFTGLIHEKLGSMNLVFMRMKI